MAQATIANTSQSLTVQQAAAELAQLINSRSTSPRPDEIEAIIAKAYIRRQGSKVNETADLFGLDLAGIESWIKEHAKG